MFGYFTKCTRFWYCFLDCINYYFWPSFKNINIIIIYLDNYVTVNRRYEKLVDVADCSYAVRIIQENIFKF